MFSELKVITVDFDQEKFENDVNGWCCNCGYKIISCQYIPVNGDVNNGVTYVAFLGKSYD